MSRWIKCHKLPSNSRGRTRGAAGASSLKALTDVSTLTLDLDTFCSTRCLLLFLGVLSRWEIYDGKYDQNVYWYEALKLELRSSIGD